MDYRVLINGNQYDLPNYTLKVAESLESIELLNGGNQRFRDKCKRMYDFVGDCIGKADCEKELGKLDEVDPNELNITYLDIVQSYNQPLNDYNNGKLEDALNSNAVRSITKLVDSSQKVVDLGKKK